MANTSFEVGQVTPYLYKHYRETFTVQATILAINGSQIKIEFISPAGGYLRRITLASPQDRARLGVAPIARPVKAKAGRPVERDGTYRKITIEMRTDLYDIAKARPEPMRELLEKAMEQFLQIGK